MLREAAHVHLVDQGAGEWRAERPIALPVVGRRRGDDAPHRGGAVVARAHGRVAVVERRHGDRQAVGIDEHLLRVEPEAALRRKRAVSAVGVDLAGVQARHEHVPVVIGAVPARFEPDDVRRPLASASSKSSSSIAVALFENTLKLTPSGVTVAPSGALVPGFSFPIVHRRHSIGRKRAA